MLHRLYSHLVPLCTHLSVWCMWDGPVVFSSHYDVIGHTDPPPTHVVSGSLGVNDVPELLQTLLQFEGQSTIQWHKYIMRCGGCGTACRTVSTSRSKSRCTAFWAQPSSMKTTVSQIAARASFNSPRRNSKMAPTFREAEDKNQQKQDRTFVLYVFYFVFQRKQN